MFTLAFIEARAAMRRRLTGALATDPVVPSARTVEQRRASRSTAAGPRSAARTWRSSPHSRPGATKTCCAASRAAIAGPSSAPEEIQANGTRAGSGGERRAGERGREPLVRGGRGGAPARRDLQRRARTPPTRRRPAPARRRRRSARAARPARPARARRRRAARPARAPSRTSARRAGWAARRRARRRPRRRARTRRAPRRRRRSRRPGTRAQRSRSARRGSTAPVGSAGLVRSTARVVAPARSRISAGAGGTGTARPPAASTSSGSGCQPGQRDERLAAAARAARRRRRAAARPRRGRARPAPARRRGAPRAPRARGVADAVGIRVQRPPQRERRGVDRLGVRRLVPRRAGQVERLDAAERAPPLARRGARAARARPPRAASPRTAGSTRGSAASPPSARRERGRRALDAAGTTR